MKRAAELWRRHWPAFAVLLLALAAALPLLSAPRAAPVARHVEWPREWEGRALRPLSTTTSQRPDQGVGSRSGLSTQSGLPGGAAS